MVRKVKKKKSGLRIFIELLLMVVFASFVCKFIITSGDLQLFKKEYVDKSLSNFSFNPRTDSSEARKTPVSLYKVENDSSALTALDKLNSSNAILVRLKDHAILMQKNSEEKIYPASLTKMMTAIVAIENLHDLKGEIKLTNSMFKGLYEVGASMAGFQPGEQVRAIDLLYGIMLPSGAECCIGLANKIAGSEKNFVKMMNQKAVDIGLENTHFENTTGLHDDNHYTTVKDLAVLLSYALKNDTFQEIFTSPRHSTPPTNKHIDGITFNSTMFEKLNDNNITGGEIVGGKTGFTSEAGLCLASLAKVNKQEYILVTVGAKGDSYSEQFNITDALAVYSSIGE